MHTGPVHKSLSRKIGNESFISFPNETLLFSVDMTHHILISLSPTSMYMRHKLFWRQAMEEDLNFDIDFILYLILTLYQSLGIYR